MARLVINTDQIVRNIEKISSFLQGKKIQWSLIVKILSGHKDLLKEILSGISTEKIHSVGDSRLTGLRALKEINPELTTMYIKPPAHNNIKQVVKYADISLNSSSATIEALNREAKNQGKFHKVIIMIDMGELREGIMGENLEEFYRKVFTLSNIEIIGIGTNLGCLFGVEPTRDKLVQLSLYKQLIDAIFKTRLPLISGGSSITLPLTARNKIPFAVNHFRIGEAAFMGTSPLDGKRFRNLSDKGFEYSAQILQIEEKEHEPDGVIGQGHVGKTSEEIIRDENTSFKALLDFGIIDVDPNDLIPVNKSVRFFGTTSDLTIYDLGNNRKKNGTPLYRVGEIIRFKPDYMAVARLMNSKFIEKDYSS